MVVETEQVTMRQSDLYCGENNQSTDEVNIQLKKKTGIKECDDNVTDDTSNIQSSWL